MKPRERIEAAKTATFRAWKPPSQARQAGWRSARTGKLWRSTLDRRAYPTFGALPVQPRRGAGAEGIEANLGREDGDGELARAGIENILNAAKVLDYRTGEN